MANVGAAYRQEVVDDPSLLAGPSTPSSAEGTLSRDRLPSLTHTTLTSAGRIHPRGAIIFYYMRPSYLSDSPSVEASF